MPEEPIDRILSHLKTPTRTANGYLAHCPAHEDKEKSLSISTGDDGRVLLKCFAGCTVKEIVKSMRLEMRDLFPRGGRGVILPAKPIAHLHTPKKPIDTNKESLCLPPIPVHTGCTLQAYAGAKKLPSDFLRGLGLSDIDYLGHPAVRIPYYDTTGKESGAVRIRKNLEKTEGADERFAWKKGSRLSLYGLDRKYREKYRIIVEGESDCQTLWLHGFPAIGVPGADNWKEDRDAPYFDEVDNIYIIIEPDQGGEAVKKWLAKSRIRSKAQLIFLGEHKDPSGLYLADPEHFRDRFQKTMDKAVPWADLEREESDRIKQDAWGQCKELAECGDILGRFVSALSRAGVVGEENISKILYLGLVSRFLERPVSIALRGPSSGGKSFLVETGLKFFPPSAFYALTSMSEHSLAYGEEPLKHRFLILYEAAGLNSDLASYLLRSLLSEGRVRYETVEKTKDGLRPRLIEREGPTGAIITTTEVKLHPENETRLLSLTITDTPEQTAKIILSLAEKSPGDNIDFTPWHSLQEWLERSEHRVVIPYATNLARAIPPLAVRLRRDFTTVLTLIRAHAILHQVGREKGGDSSIVASIEDYAVVRGLVVDSLAEGIGATVSTSVRETVGAVEKLIQEGSEYSTIAQVAQALNLDRSATSRRVNAAIEKGYLANIEEKKGKPKRIIIGDLLPEEIAVLPPPEKLGVCSRAAVHDRINTPPSPPPPKPSLNLKVKANTAKHPPFGSTDLSLEQPELFPQRGRDKANGDDVNNLREGLL
jgi:hypothetical protein